MQVFIEDKSSGKKQRRDTRGNFTLGRHLEMIGLQSDIDEMVVHRNWRDQLKRVNAVWVIRLCIRSHYVWNRYITILISS